MITYGHEKFIKDALLGVLSQQVNFNIEVILSNDCSPDDTDRIIKQKINTHQNGHWVRYIRHTKNIGMLANFVWALSQCSGKYIAYCEGDDYWIDPYKLQKQVDILEQHEECTLCFHQGLRIDQVTDRYDTYPHAEEKFFDAKSFFKLTTIPMASVVFRNNIELKFLPFHKQPDFILLCNLFSNGKAYFIKEVMSVYRKHIGGVSFDNMSQNYLNGRVKSLQLEMNMQELSVDVRKEIKKIYLLHRGYLVERYHQQLSKRQILNFLVGNYFKRKFEGNSRQNFILFKALFNW